MFQKVEPRLASKGKPMIWAMTQASTFFGLLHLCIGLTAEPLKNITFQIWSKLNICFWRLALQGVRRSICGALHWVALPCNSFCLPCGPYPIDPFRNYWTQIPEYPKEFRDSPTEYPLAVGQSSLRICCQWQRDGIPSSSLLLLLCSSRMPFCNRATCWIGGFITPTLGRTLWNDRGPL